jgi:cathepsin F
VYFLKNNPLTSLSVEQIVDCDGEKSDTGDEHADCGVYGGWPYLAIEFIKKIVFQST